MKQLYEIDSSLGEITMANTKPVGVAFSDPELVAGTTITGATISGGTITSATSITSTSVTGSDVITTGGL
ncbi:MAG: hypothetical protein EBY02_07585, partial [Burkholderiaceae bacterium]|nr:hypothetical protein [Burkholderiaceae bacterium]